MAFVYCDPRWKRNNENVAPGPGEYEMPVNRVRTGVAKTKSSIFFKRNAPMTAVCKDESSQILREATVHERLHCGVNNRCESGRDGGRRGKLIRKSTGVRHRQSLQQEQSCDLQINLNPRGHQTIANVNKYGNKKIFELVRQNRQTKQKQSLRRNNISNTMSVQKNSCYTHDKKQKLQDDLKEIQILYSSNKNKIQNPINIKVMNKEISSKQKQRQNKSHNYYGSINKIQTGVNDNNGQMYIQPSAVYKSLHQETQDLISHQSTLENGPLKSLKVLVKDRNMQTRVSSQLLDDSVQYIDDATPGPGAYDLDQRALARSKSSGMRVEKFGVTIERFKNKREVVPQTQINPYYPLFKKSSKARQEEVGFGRTTKQDKETKGVHNGIFYENTNTLQNIARKTILKSASSGIGFQSGKQRFQYQQKKKSQDSDTNQEKDVEQHEIVQVYPSSVFMSTVQRDIPFSVITENVDFTGQNLGCLAHKQKKLKQFYEDYEIQPASFNTRQSRFIYKQPKQEGKKEELKLIKIKELKEKEEKKKSKSPEKGYSFGHEQKKEIVPKQVPSPDKYDYCSEWTKKSYNLRFG